MVVVDGEIGSDGCVQMGKPRTASDAFAVLLDRINNFGRWQWRLMFIAGFCGVFTGLHNLAAVFLAASPDHWCDIPYLNDTSTYEEGVRNITTPWVKNKDGDLSPSKCLYYNSTVLDSAQELAFEPGQLRCTEWHYDTSIYSSTIVSEYNLVCNRKWLMSIIQSTYMLGILTGAVIFSAVSDSWGRRKSSLFCVVSFIISSLLVSLSSSLNIFLVLRFIVAASGQGMYLVNYVLLMEYLGEKGRAVLGNSFHLGFSVGFSLLSLIAYYVRDWSNLQLVISVPTILLLLYYWILPESPRWLLVKGRYDEGTAVLKSIAKVNGRDLPPKEELNELLNVIRKEVIQNESNKESLRQKFATIMDSILILVRTKNMRRRNLITFYAWFVTSMMYYGLTFNGANINASLYLNVFLSGIVEVPAILFTVASLYRFGRRPVLFFTMTLSGLACVGIAFVPKAMVWANISLSMIGKGLSSSAFILVFMFSAELVPTNVRNISIGMASMWGRIGSALSPFIVDLLGEVYYAIPSTVFGVAAIISGLLITLLPEPAKRRLPESVQEIESLDR